MSQLKVLIVDDYQDALDAWEYFLSSRGFQVITADNGNDAIAKAEAELPDIVVLDLDLPGRHGLEVARHLQEQPATKRIPLVAMTGQSHSRELDRARAAGFKAVLTKPYDPESLAVELQRICASETPPFN